MTTKKRKQYCSIFRHRVFKSKIFGKKCINPFCYNFFLGQDQYQGAPKQCCSLMCVEMRKSFVYYMNGNKKKITLSDPQSIILFELIKEKYHKDLY